METFVLLVPFCLWRNKDCNGTKGFALAQKTKLVV